jgi:REP element-mobilizing transposase RayT
MSQSLVRIYAHLVFSTKNRQPFLRDKDLRKECHAYLAGACKNLGSPSLTVGGAEDHVHILCFLSKVERVSDLIRELKRVLPVAQNQGTGPRVLLLAKRLRGVFHQSFSCSGLKEIHCQPRRTSSS